MSTALATTVIEKEISYVPFGADASDPSNAIKLSVSIIKQFVSVRTKSGAVCDDQQAMKFLLLCKARKLNPFEGDCYLVGYDSKDGPSFSLITAHQAFLKRAELNPEFDGMTSGVIVKDKDGNLTEQEGDFYTTDQTLVGGWAKVFFKTRTHPMFKKLNLSTFRKPFGVWNSDPAGMIVKCAEADALRSSFPTMMAGMHLQQEIEAHQTEVTVLPPTQSRLVNRVQKALPPAAATANGGSSAAPASSSLPGQSAPAQSREEPAPVTTPTRGRPPKAPPAAVAPKPPEPVESVPMTDPDPDPTPEEPQPDGGPDPFAPSETPAPIVVTAPSAVEPLSASTDIGETTQRIRTALKNEGLTEDQLMEWLRGANMAKPAQTYVSQLASSKLEIICTRWTEIVEDLKAPV